MSYLKINGTEFDNDIAISEYTQSYSVLDGDNAGRVLTGRMSRDIIGTFVTYKVTVFRRGDNYQGFDEFFDFLKEHSVDDSVQVELMDGQRTISFEAYYTSFERSLPRVVNGINYWDEVEVHFISMDAEVTP
jgi:hypothetical protein